MKNLLIPIVGMISVVPSLAAPTAEQSSAVVSNYAQLVESTYRDSLIGAQRLQTAVNAFVEEPTAQALESAKTAWILARAPYLQTEVFRFYGGPIDDDGGPEGLLNAWPMDEVYVDSVPGNLESGIIPNAEDYPEITKELLISLNERDGEKNIATGYHAIEFLLWGQDLSADGPGNRPFEDFTSAPHAKRRGEYLVVVTDLLVDHLQGLTDTWSADGGEYRKKFESQDSSVSIQSILTGMGMLSGFELAGERLLVAVETGDQEDEHSCFSDTTNQDVIYDALGLMNVWKGEYGDVSGPGIKALAERIDPDLAGKIDRKVSKAFELSKKIPVPFDQALVSEEGQTAIMAVVTELEDQAELLKTLGEKLGVEVPITE